MRIQNLTQFRRRLLLATGLGSLLGAALLWPVAGSVAQPAARATPAAAAAPAPAQPDGPERTSAQFGDWSVNCNGRATTARACEMVMAVRDPSRQLGAALAIGRQAREAPLRLVAQLPVNVRVPHPARLVAEGAEPLVLPFQTCNRLGCFAEIELRDEAALRRLRSRPADQQGRLEWRDSAGQEMALPISFRGFTAASEALGREQR